MKVTAAACRSLDGRVWSLPRPARHYDIRMQMIAALVLEDPEQGFLLDDGTFVDRRAAGAVAFREGQTAFLSHNLQTVDLW